MSKVLKINKSAEDGVRELLKFLLESGKVKEVFTLKKINSNNVVSYSLITRAEMIKDAVPLFPLMPANAGKLLSSLTLKNPLSEPIAVVVKPCELRAFVELVKIKQGSLENFLFISSTCPGVYPLDMEVNGDLSKKLLEYWDTVKKGKIIPDIRPTCNGCEHFLPYTADMVVSLIGKNTDKECEIFLTTNKGEKFAEGIGKLVEGELETQEIESLRNERKIEKKKLFDEIKIEKFGLSGLIETFGKCIGCHGCSHICPICYCILCTFESCTHELEPSAYESEIEKKGGMRIPPNTVFYHIGRLAHIGISCVGCGMCTDVCPVNIPISTIFLKVSEEVQDVFNYIPGKNIEEEIPLVKYDKEELTEVED